MIDITIDRKSDKPLYAQIRDALKELIEHRELKPGDQLPTVVSLASQAGVTQCTVRRAYEDLTKAELLISQVGRGTFVCEPEAKSSADEGTESGRSRRPSPLSSDSEARQAARRFRAGISKGLDSLVALKHRPGLIKFVTGVPVPNMIREGVLKDLVLDALKEGEEKYAFGGDSQGLLQLRLELVERFSRNGLDVTPEQILITNGSQQAFALVAQAALEDGRRIICESPCYTGVPNAFNAAGHWVETVSRDQGGPLPDRLQRFSDGRPSLFYLCPLLHNPMGLDISPERRRMVLRWARQQEAVIISDDIFRGLHFDGRNPPYLLADRKKLDQSILVGSVSKTFLSGIRVGWLVSSPGRVRTLVGLKQSMDRATPPLLQGMVLSLLKSGEYDNHMERVREQYRVRCEAVVTALKRYMPREVTWTVPEGGFNMWVELPVGYSSMILFLLAVERGVAFIPGPYMDIDHRFVNAFRLSYTDLDPEKIDEGIRLLGLAVRDLLKEEPSEMGLGGLGDFL